MNNWTISEESKQLLRELKPLIEKHIHLPPKVYKCKYCSKILEIQDVSRINYCDDWCKEMALEGRRSKTKRRTCVKCDEPVQPYMNKKRNQVSSVYAKYCDKCSPVKQRKYNTIKLNKDIQ